MFEIYIYIPVLVPPRYILILKQSAQGRQHLQLINQVHMMGRKFASKFFCLCSWGKWKHANHPRCIIYYFKFDISFNLGHELRVFCLFFLLQRTWRGKKDQPFLDFFCLIGWTIFFGLRTVERQLCHSATLTGFSLFSSLCSGYSSSPSFFLSFLLFIFNLFQVLNLSSSSSSSSVIKSSIMFTDPVACANIGQYL